MEVKIKTAAEGRAAYPIAGCLNTNHSVGSIHRRKVYFSLLFTGGRGPVLKFDPDRNTGFRGRAHTQVEILSRDRASGAWQSEGARRRNFWGS